jgi:carbon storage regulator
MLVLSRKLGERILIPHCDLAVTVVPIEGNTVRLGFSAPAEIGIYREEVWRRVGPSREPCAPSLRPAGEDPGPAHWPHEGSRLPSVRSWPPLALSPHRDHRPRRVRPRDQAPAPFGHRRPAEREPRAATQGSLAPATQGGAIGVDG